MSDRVFFDVDPATLHLPNERIDGADPAKLQRQIAKRGRYAAGVGVPWFGWRTDVERRRNASDTRGKTLSRLGHPRRTSRFFGPSGRPPSHGQGETTMSTIEHDDLMESLAELRQALPSMRLGQLIANMATIARGAVRGAIWDMEDEELLRAIRWQLEQLASPVVAGEAEPGAAPDRGGVPPSSASTAPDPPRQSS